MNTNHPSGPGPRPLALSRAIVVSACASSVACGMFIGLDQRSGRAPDAGIAETDAVVPVDAGTPDGASFCAQATGAFFCDDFDLPNQNASDRWTGSPSLGVGSPIIAGEAGVTIVTPTLAQSPPNALEATLNDTVVPGLTTGVLIKEFSGALAKEGFVLAFHVQAIELQVLDASSSYREVGPDPDLYNTPAVGIGGIFTLTPAFKRYGLAFGVGNDDLVISEGAEGTATDNYARVARFNLRKLGDQGWLRLWVATGPRDRVLAYTSALIAPPKCPAGEFITVAFTSIVRTESACLRADPVASPVATAANFIVVLGATTSDPARARFRFDNVRLDSLQ